MDGRAFTLHFALDIELEMAYKVIIHLLPAGLAFGPRAGLFFSEDCPCLLNPR